MSNKKTLLITIAIIIIHSTSLAAASNFNTDLAIGKGGDTHPPNNFILNLCIGSGAATATGNFNINLGINSNCLLPIAITPLPFQALSIICNDCDSPDPVKEYMPHTFTPQVKCNISQILAVTVCDTPYCNRKIYCTNTTHVISGNYRLRTCTHAVEELQDYEPNIREYWIHIRNALGNTQITHGGKFIIQKNRDPPRLHLKAPETIILEINTQTHETIFLTNSQPVADTVHLEIYSVPEKLSYWLTFPEQTGKQTLELTLDPYEQRSIPMNLFAGKTGTYRLTLFAQSKTSNTLYNQTDIRVEIINRDKGAFSRTPGLNILPVIIIIIMAACIFTSKRIS